MAALNFPASPSDGDLYFANDRQWKWSSSEGGWKVWNDFPLGLDSRVEALGQSKWLFRSYSVELLCHASAGSSFAIGNIGGAWALFNPRGSPSGVGFYVETNASLGMAQSWLTGKPDGTLTWAPNTGTDESIWHNGNFPHGSRQTSTPTVTPASGSFTTVSCEVNYERVGDHYEWDCTITITDNGTAAGHINVPMPFTAVKECIGVGRQCAISGSQCQGVIPATANAMTVVKYDNSYPGATGERITLSGKTFVS